MVACSCACGAVRFHLTEAPTKIVTCHCSRCRKLGADVFVFVKQGTLEWESGRDNVTHYAPTPPNQFNRYFCKTCGTALGEVFSNADVFPVVANVMDTPVDLSLAYHEFTVNCPSWHVIGDDAPQYDGFPPE